MHKASGRVNHRRLPSDDDDVWIRTGLQDYNGQIGLESRPRMTYLGQKSIVHITYIQANNQVSRGSKPIKYSTKLPKTHKKNFF